MPASARGAPISRNGSLADLAMVSANKSLKAKKARAGISAPPKPSTELQYRRAASGAPAGRTAARPPERHLLPTGRGPLHTACGTHADMRSPGVDRRPDRHAKEGSSVSLLVALSLHHPEHLLQPLAFQDRKSTRLNSQSLR